MNKTKQNPWKILFFVGLGINIVVFLTIIFMVGIPQDVPKIENTKTEQEQTSIMMKSNKESLNKLISNGIEKNRTENSLDYKVLLTDNIEFYTKIPVFDQMLQLKMTFTPVPLQNGDLLLEQKSMELGQMKLPVSYVLNFIKKQEGFPEWLIVNSKKKQIHVSLQQLVLFDDLKVKVNAFDLKNDNISFSLIIPSEKTPVTN